MAWTDYSTTLPADWDGAAFAAPLTATDCMIDNVTDANFFQGAFTSGNVLTRGVSPLGESYNIPGFEDGFQPAGVPDPIVNNIDEGGGGGGSTRPSSGFLYPRGQG